MNPKYWGPPGWVFIHSIAYGYPENPSSDEQLAMIDFLNSLQHILPCKTCSELYKKDIKELPNLTSTVKNRDLLIKWVNKMHNKVNENLNKKQYSDKEYENYYYNNDNFNKKTNSNFYLIITLIIVFISIIYYILQ